MRATLTAVVDVATVWVVGAIVNVVRGDAATEEVLDRTGAAKLERAHF